MTSGSSREDELSDRRLSVSSRRSQQMRRMEEIELEDYVLGEGKHDYIFKFRNFKNFVSPS